MAAGLLMQLPFIHGERKHKKLRFFPSFWGIGRINWGTKDRAPVCVVSRVTLNVKHDTHVRG